MHRWPGLRGHNLGTPGPKHRLGCTKVRGTKFDCTPVRRTNFDCAKVRRFNFDCMKGQGKNLDCTKVQGTNLDFMNGVASPPKSGPTRKEHALQQTRGP